MLILSFLIFVSSKLQIKKNHFLSKTTLSTFFFEDAHSKISIQSKFRTYFFITNPNTENITYTIMQGTNYDDGKIIKRKGLIHREHDYIPIVNANYAMVYFNFSKNIIRKLNKRSITKKIPSVSFISFPEDDKCQNGIEFISSRENFEHRNIHEVKMKCYFLSLINQNVPLLYTDDRIYESFIIKVDHCNNNSNHLLMNETNLYSGPSLSKQEHIKAVNKGELFSEKSKFKIENEYRNSKNNDVSSCKHGKKYLQTKNFSFSIINPIACIIIAFFCVILLIVLCTGKSAVETEEPSDHNIQSNIPNNNYDQTPIVNLYNSPVVNPMLGMNTSPTNTNPYTNIFPQQMNCTYHDNVQPNQILPPTNPSFQGGPSPYAGTIPYFGAVPMPHPC